MRAAGFGEAVPTPLAGWDGMKPYPCRPSAASVRVCRLLSGREQKKNGEFRNETARIVAPIGGGGCGGAGGGGDGAVACTRYGKGRSFAGAHVLRGAVARSGSIFWGPRPRLSAARNGSLARPGVWCRAFAAGDVTICLF